MAVPKEVQHRVGTKLITCSLRTGDHREASIRAWKKRAELFEEWGLIAADDGPACLPSARHMPTEAELEYAAVMLGYELPREEAEAARKTLRGKGPNMYRAHVQWTKAELEEQIRAVATGDFEPVRDLANAAVDALNLDLAPGSEAYDTLCTLLNDARLADLQEQYRRNLGGTEVETSSKLVQRVREREAIKAKAGETILELFELYAHQRVEEGGKRRAGVDQDRMVISLFAEFVGPQRAIRSISRDECRDFRNTIAKLPTNFRKRKEYRELSIRDAAEQATRNGAPTLSPVTRARYVSTVSPFFDWLVSEGYSDVQPFAGLHQKPPRGKNPRPPFTADQISKIVRSPLFTGFEADGKEHLRGNVRADDWRYWIPLICLFSGARIGEVAQLHIKDITQEHGIWCAHLRDDETIGQHTKSRKTRIVPLHSTLIAIGVLDFVKRQQVRSKVDGNPQLFPELQPGKREQFGDEPSDWWRDYLKKIGVKNGKDGFGAHSFRHTMSDQLKAAGFLEREYGPLILGHADTTTTTGYGQLQQGTIRRRHDMIEAAAFVAIENGRVVEDAEQVDFSHLIAGAAQPR